jgi:hypothetical protein
MSKTKRRNIKKKNTRRKNSRSFTKSKSKSVSRLYRRRVNKTRRHGSQRGGGVTFMGVDDKTGHHMYWSDYLGKMIKVAPLPSVPSKKSEDAIRLLEKQISRMPLAGIQDAHGLAPVNIIEARKALLQVRALPEPGKKKVPVDLKKQLEDDKQLTKLQAEFIEKQQIDKDDTEVAALFVQDEPQTGKKKIPSYLLSDTPTGTPKLSRSPKSPSVVAGRVRGSTVSPKEEDLDSETLLAMYADEYEKGQGSKKQPSYLLSDTLMSSKSPRGKSPKSMGAVASFGRARSSSGSRKSSKDSPMGDMSPTQKFIKELEQTVHEGDNPPDFSLAKDYAKLVKQNKEVSEIMARPLGARVVSKRPQPSLQLRPQAAHAAQATKPVKPAVVKGAIQRFNELKEKVTEMLDRDSLNRLTKILPMLKLSQQDMEKLFKGLKNPCLQKYFLYRSEGRQPGQFSLTVSDLVRMDGKLKSCKDMRAVLSSEGMLPLDQALWVPDSQCSHSAIGGEKFGIFTRRHHCRCCGRCVTNEYMEQNTNPKICTECSRLIGNS